MQFRPIRVGSSPFLRPTGLRWPYLTLALLSGLFCLAVATAGQPGGGDVQPDPATVRAVADDEATPSVEEVRRRLSAGGADWAIWLDESEPDLLYLAARVKEAKEVGAFAGGALVTMRSIGDPEEGLYVGALRQPAMRRATLSVHVGPRQEHSIQTMGSIRNAWGRFISPTYRGPEAPAGHELATALAGTVRTEQVPSEAMGGPATVTIYLPPGYDASAVAAGRAARPAVVYFGDGGIVASMAHAIEPLILSGRIPPTVLVGAHTSDAVTRPPHLPPKPAPAGEGPKTPIADDSRAMEYLLPEASMEREDPDTHAVHTYMFDRHFRYFADELPAWAQQTLGVSDRPEDRVITGFSNSAAFVITLSQRRPGQYGGVIANSVAGSSPGGKLPEEATATRFMIASGTWEGFFTTNSDGWAAHLAEQGATVERLKVVGGHDAAIWEMALVRGLPWLLSADGQAAPQSAP